MEKTMRTPHLHLVSNLPLVITLFILDYPEIFVHDVQTEKGGEGGGRCKDDNKLTWLYNSFHVNMKIIRNVSVMFVYIESLLKSTNTKRNYKYIYKS